MADFIVAGVVLIIVGIAGGFVVRSRKKGIKCIGCPSGCSCPSQGCGCSGNKGDAQK